MKVSRIMSTQHPDNVRSPFFSENHVLEGDDEIREAFYCFSQLGCREQLWDCEGKEVDSFVVKKLLSRYDEFFRKNKLGEDFFITLRVPNPSVERNEAKVLLETLESIPRSHDIAEVFYEDGVSPIFEVCQPMTSSAEELLRIHDYYKDFVVGKKKKVLHGLKISDWVGDVMPEKIRVTPLLEDRESMLNSHLIAKKYIEKAGIHDFQRVWLARSDPALNYGNLAAVLIEKIALQRLHDLQGESSVEILPILGCGSAPFRGNLKPTNVKSMLSGYPSVHTFTVQSAFKYDYDSSDVMRGVEELNESRRKNPIFVDEGKCLGIIDKISSSYKEQVKLLAPVINDFSRHIPSRRKRKLHIGLFGYSRASDGVNLPRAIKFCASLYSLGVPPELLGLNAVSEQELDYVSGVYPSLFSDLEDSVKFLNPEGLKMFPSLEKSLKPVIGRFNVGKDQNSLKATTAIIKAYKSGKNVLQEDILRAGSARGFLG